MFLFFVRLLIQVCLTMIHFFFLVSLAQDFFFSSVCHILKILWLKEFQRWVIKCIIQQIALWWKYSCSCEPGEKKSRARKSTLTAEGAKWKITVGFGRIRQIRSAFGPVQFLKWYRSVKKQENDNEFASFFHPIAHPAAKRFAVLIAKEVSKLVCSQLQLRHLILLSWTK